jgi:hypothetical protein
MLAQERSVLVRAWRDRVREQVVFDRSTAEAAIRRAYQESALREPNLIVWARGPRHAARMIAFLKRPPGWWQRVALGMLVLGALGWVGLLVAIDGHVPVAKHASEAAIWSLAFGALGLALGVGPRLPAWPGIPPPRCTATLILLGAVVYLALAGHGYALQRLGSLPTDPLWRSLALVLAVSVGALPGVFLELRIRRAYAHLPRSLLDLRPARSVAHRLERARRAAWEPLPHTRTGARAHESLLQAYDAAQREAFFGREPGATGLHGVAASAPATMADVSGERHPETSGVMPPHLDGMTDAARAAAVDRAGASGAAASFAELAFRVDRIYPFAAVAVAVRPPVTVALDAEGRPHAEDGPALAWADGTHVYAWHGRVVAADLINRQGPVEYAHIVREPDPNRRWVLIERYGLGRYLLEAGASEIQRDDCGRLYRLAQPWAEPIVAVRVVNHTPESDGTFREFWLRVPPTMTKARDAVAWTFDLTPQQYDPVAQS